MVGNRATPAVDRRRAPRAVVARAFSLVDVLVTLAVISILIGLLLPTLSGVRETTRQVVCRSNVRQVGFGIAMFADAHYLELLPLSRYPANEAQRTIQVRSEGNPYTWDGLGYLYSEEYLDAPGVFYCPSHTGTHPASLYVDRWALQPSETPPGMGDIVINYQYRGEVMVQGHTVHSLSGVPGRVALVSDALTSWDDFNHRIGTNILRADLSASWYPDAGRRFLLPAGDADPDAAGKVIGMWGQLDRPPGEPPQ